MFKKSTKSAIFMVVAVLMVAALLLTACTDAFKPVEMPASATPESNGGNAIKYGEWIYYVNGYQSSSSAENTYTQITARVGAIARIKEADLASLFAVYDDPEISDTARPKKIASIVAEKAQIVVPKFYYSGNTTSTQINGIYIFNDRLYMLTPNDELTAGGNSLTSQSVLTSFKLDGSDEQRHYVFTNSAAQVLLSMAGEKLVATYIMDSEVGCIDVANGTKIVSAEETKSAQFDVAGEMIAFLNKDGSVCKLNAGASEVTTLVENVKEEGSDHSHITYTIVNVNNGYVYYTKADSTNSSIDGTHVFYANEASADVKVALKAAAPSSNWYGYEDKIVLATTQNAQGISLYGIDLVDSEGHTIRTIVNPVQNDNSITFNRIEGKMLYYTSNSIAYKVDLSDDQSKPIAFGRGLSSTGWSVPDFIGDYVITLSNDSVTVVKFDVDKKENSKSVTLTVVEPDED